MSPRLLRAATVVLLLATSVIAACDGATPKGDTEDVVMQIPFV